MKKTAYVLVLFALLMNPSRILAGDEGKRILERMYTMYSEAKSFSADAEYYSETSHKPPMTDKRTMSLIYKKPDHLKLSWTEIQMGGALIRNTIFTRDGELFFYWQLFNEYRKEESIFKSIGAAAGISRGLSMYLPSLLIGAKEYMELANVKTRDDKNINGIECYVVVGDKSNGKYEYAISKDNYALIQIKEIQEVKSKDIGKMMSEARKEAPHIDIPDMPTMPDFTTRATTTFININIDLKINEKEFDEELPEGAKLVDQIPSNRTL